MVLDTSFLWAISFVLVAFMGMALLLMGHGKDEGNGEGVTTSHRSDLLGRRILGLHGVLVIPYSSSHHRYLTIKSYHSLRLVPSGSEKWWPSKSCLTQIGHTSFKRRPACHSPLLHASHSCKALTNISCFSMRVSIATIQGRRGAASLS